MPVVPIHAADAPLDRLGRPMHDLRISVMDRCNFRCPYCMPKDTYGEAYRFLTSDERLSFAEIERLARLFATLGVRKLRLTGGEPLLRSGLEELVGDLAVLPDIEDVALTTNGVLLARYAMELKAQGLRRVTVSLDSLDPETFRRLSGGFGSPEQVLEGIEAALARGARAGEGELRRTARRERRGRARPARALPPHAGDRPAHRVHGRRHAQPLGPGARRALAGTRGAHRGALAHRAGRRELPRRSRRALCVCGRRGRTRLHQLREPAVLRRVLARQALVRGRAVHVPVREPRHRPARAAAQRRGRCGADRAHPQRLARPHGPLQRTARRSARAGDERRIEMYYIGG